MTTHHNPTAAHPTSGPLAGRVAVVTGATSGIGAGTARELAAGGAAVALVGRRADRLTGLAAELTEAGAPAALPLPADVTDPAALARAAEAVRAELGRPDLVVANAGVMLGGAFESTDTAEWDRMLDVNLRGLLTTGRVFADDLIAAAADGGPADLVHIGSVASEVVFPDYAVYGATKAAVAQLSRNLRAALGPRGVRVRTVEPGIVLTELGADISDQRARDVLADLRTAFRSLAPEDIGATVAYAAAAPPHVNIAEMVVVPTPQG
ncbi:SDR family oxidoreductase [Streptomyces sp. M19]